MELLIFQGDRLRKVVPRGEVDHSLNDWIAFGRGRVSNLRRVLNSKAIVVSSCRWNALEIPD